ncbi:MAG: DUF4012 domain-containing protein, partial [Dehalococcoidia bacterium]
MRRAFPRAAYVVLLAVAWIVTRTFGLFRWGLLRVLFRRRLAVPLAIALVVIGAWLAIATVFAANDARAEVTALINEASSVTAAGLLEPGVYARISDRSEQTLEAVERVRSRLGLFRPIEFIPGLGGRVRAARNTVDLGSEVAFAANRVLRAYEEALTTRRAGGREALEAAMVAHGGALLEAEAALDRAAVLVTKPLVINDREIALVTASIEALRSLALIAIVNPATVDEGLEFVRVVSDMQGLLNAPLETLGDTEHLAGLISELRQRGATLRDNLLEIQEATQARSQTVQLAIDGLAVVSEGTEAAAALLGVVDAMELGVFSQSFGADVGSRLREAEERLERAGSLLSALEQSFESTAGVELGSTVPGGGIFGTAREAMARTVDAVEALKSFLGYEGPRNYLVVLQNQDEIRATGGFIGATIELPFQDGVLGEVKFDDSTRIDRPPLINNPTAPEPIFWYLWIA